MILKGQDVLISLKLIIERRGWTYSALAASLGMSVSETHGSVKRAMRCGLLYIPLTGTKPKPDFRRLRPFLIHGLPVCMPLESGPPAKGLPTSYAASPLNKQLDAFGLDLGPVWPATKGDRHGFAVAPLYPTVPAIASHDPILYEWLVVVDGLRDRDARVRRVAQNELEKRMSEISTAAA